jgi:hypothetical protein
MKPLIFNFYRLEDCVGENGATLDYGKVAAACPIDSIRARPRVVLRMHLEHLGFEISRALPQLEGQLLHAELVLAGSDNEPKRLMLVALREGRAIATRPVRLETLDMSPFHSVLRAKRPELKGTHVVFRLTQTEEEGDTGESTS